MSVQFVIGSAGSGKSYLLYKNMISKSLENKDKNFVAVVPEQYSMEAQKEILDIHENHGSFNIEVTSFNRLAYTVFEEQGVNGLVIMDDLGKTLVVRKVLEECKNQLSVYKNKTSMPGFAEKIKTVISEFKQYGIHQDKLTQITEYAKERPSLKHKMEDIAVINDAFNSYIEEKMITTEDVLSIFCKYIPLSDYISNTYLYFDGFTGFTPSQYQVLELLIKFAPEVHITITLPENEATFTKWDKYELFALSKETISKIKSLAIDNGIKVQKDLIAGAGQQPCRIKDNQGLCFIEKNIFRTGKSLESRSTDSVGIHINKNPHAEASFVASSISQLIHSSKYRYNDIAVITGDIEGYHRYLEEEFEKYSIPSFIDYKRNISSNPFVEGIKAAIEIIEKDFSYESVFHMLRLGFSDMDAETIDIMENYVLVSGRKYYKSYATCWEKLYKGMNREDLDVVNRGREGLLNMIKPLRDKLKDQRATVRDYTVAVYEFIQNMRMQEKIQQLADNFRDQGMISEEKEYQQIYESIITVLDKIVALMGDEVLSIKEYKQILQAGFECVKVGIIPPGLDTVMVGDIERTRLKDIKKIIFFIGVNDDVIPGADSGGGVITDSDREFLEGNDIVLAPTARENVFRQKFYLYSLLAKPTEKLIFSYCKSSSDGSVKRKSYLINEILKLFPGTVVTDQEYEDFDITSLTNKRAALDYLSRNIADYKHYLNREERDEKTVLFEQLCAVLLQDQDCREKIRLMIDGNFYSSRELFLDKEVARQIYGIKDNIGITRLERFAACAYSQFLNNGLKLGERKKFEIAAFDIGNLYHDTINRFFNKVQHDKVDWTELTKSHCMKIVSECVDTVMEEYENDAISSNARNLFIKEKVKETAIGTADILVKHIKAGRFVPAEYELKVEHGRIDRVDLLEKDNQLYVKVIDYKSGNKKFSVTDTFMGIQMQLMVYLKDAIQYEQKKNPDKEVLPAGGLYFHIHDPFVAKPDFNRIVNDYRKNNPDSDLDDKEIKLNYMEEQQYKDFRMSGLVNSQMDVIGAMDFEMRDASKTSKIIPVNTVKDGIGSRSVVLNSDDYNKFINYVSEKADAMKEQIMDGVISINPVEGACDYCPYGGVCRFDRKLGDRYREKENVTLKEVADAVDREAAGRN